MFKLNISFLENYADTLRFFEKKSPHEYIFQMFILKMNISEKMVF